MIKIWSTPGTLLLDRARSKRFLSDRLYIFGLYSISLYDFLPSLCFFLQHFASCSLRGQVQIFEMPRDDMAANEVLHLPASFGDLYSGHWEMQGERNRVLEAERR